MLRSLIVAMVLFAITSPAFAQVTSITNEGLFDTLFSGFTVLNEDFNGFGFTAFEGVVVGLNGATITATDAGLNANFISSAPGINGTPHVSAFTDGDTPITVTLAFEQPIQGFGATFESTSSGEGLQILVDEELITAQDGFFGFTSSNPVTIVTMQSATADGFLNGEGFLFDDMKFALAPTVIPAPLMLPATLGLLALVRRRRKA